MTTPILEIKNLRIEFNTRKGTLVAVDDVTLDIMPQEVFCLVGESGAGKSLTGQSIIGLLEPPGKIAAGSIRFNGKRIDNLSKKAMQKIRGREISMIFQDPLTSLNPLYSIGKQLIQTIMTHSDKSFAQAKSHAIDLLNEVGIPAAAERFDHYPHQFSGGMRQRVVIALALCTNPKLIIADEPTTALDVSIQAQVIDLLKKLCVTHQMAVILITHDMGVIAEIGDRVAVLYSGRVAEIGNVEDIIDQPFHPYTKGLINSIPVLDQTVDYLEQIDGSMPSLNRIPAGCAFNPRCPDHMERCFIERPDLVPTKPTQSACWLYADGK